MNIIDEPFFDIPLDQVSQVIENIIFVLYLYGNDIIFEVIDSCLKKSMVHILGCCSWTSLDAWHFLENVQTFR